MTERADASGCIPSPGEGKGLGLGVEASPYEIALPRQTGEPEGVRWEWLESPSRRLGIIDIRGVILCVAQFVTRKNQNLFWFFARLIVLWLRRRYSRSEKPKSFLVFRSLNRIFDLCQAFDLGVTTTPTPSCPKRPLKK